MKVGDYVRTKNYGIAKILNIYNNTTTNYSSITLDKIDSFGRLGVSITLDNIIGNPSEKPIDLIEVGDYVNGKEVIKNHYTYMGENFIDLDTNDSWEWGIGKMPTKYIKSIVTKEQFESMKYSLER